MNDSSVFQTVSKIPCVFLSVIALQCCVSFSCCDSEVNQRCVYMHRLPFGPPSSPSSPIPLLDSDRALSWDLWALQSFPRAVSCTHDPILFVLVAEQYSIVYMDHIFFIHSSVTGPLGYFCVLTVVNSAAVNNGGTSVLLNYGFLSSGTAGSVQEWRSRCREWTSSSASLFCK